MGCSRAMMTKFAGRLVAAMGAIAGLAGVADAQLRANEVLVVYDSRIADSAEVAEYYASVRPQARLLDLASTGAAATTPGDISYANFVSRLRDPIRAHLTATGAAKSTRCIVLTKGLPHRIQDTDVPNVGDDPTGLITEFNGNDITCASVDSELTLLWQNLNTGEAGGSADSLSDGLIVNPYWRARLPISTYTTANIQTAKVLGTTAPGPVRTIAGSGATRLTPGDIVLVSRLDAPTIAGVRGMIDRAQAINYDTENDVILLDASGSDNIANPTANTELDNIGGAPFTVIFGGDDYEKTRDQMNADGRWLASRVVYDQFGGQFYVGPRVDYQNVVVSIMQPLALLATFGANHGGTYPATAGGQSASNTYVDSFNYANGAIFNTIESYNGRAFGGLTAGGTNQEQASDFLAAGGTFAIAHVWEPLAATIPDNEQIAANFLRGQMTWAEAAWSSIGSLSWMHIVLGDPLATPWRTREDQRADGAPTIDDLAVWERRSPTDPLKNINRAGAADDADRQLLMQSLRFGERSDLINRRN